MDQFLVCSIDIWIRLPLRHILLLFQNQVLNFINFYIELFLLD